MKHELKILPEYFDEVVSGRKTFEVRKDDRGFQIGDTLILKEWNRGRYTGREVAVEVTYIYRGNFCKEDHCVMSIEKKGKWEEISEYNGWGDTHYRCSVCGEEWYLEDGTPEQNNMNFCPRCGACMEVPHERKD